MNFDVIDEMTHIAKISDRVLIGSLISGVICARYYPVNALYHPRLLTFAIFSIAGLFFNFVMNRYGIARIAKWKERTAIEQSCLAERAYLQWEETQLPILTEADEIEEDVPTEDYCVIEEELRTQDLLPMEEEKPGSSTSLLPQTSHAS